MDSVSSSTNSVETTDLPPREPAPWRGLATLTLPKALGLVVLFGLIAYANCFTKPFHLDDFPHIYTKNWTADFWGTLPTLMNRPLICVTLYVNQLIGGNSTPGFHLLNVAIHLLAGLTLFGVVRRTLLLPRWQGRFQENQAIWLAFGIASLWTVHPLNTHAVTYIIQRCESLMGLFIFLALYALVRGSQSFRPWAWYGLAIISALAGSLCKEVMITTPALFLLYDRIFLSQSWKETIKRRGLVHLGLLAAAWTYPVAFQYRPVLKVAEESSVGFNVPFLRPHLYFMTQTGVILHYIRLMLWPTDLCFEYRDWPLTTDWWQFLRTGIPYGLLVLATLWGVWRNRWWGFLMAGFFIVLSLTSSIVPIVDMVNEYRMYVPGVSVIGLAVAAIYAGLGRIAPGRSVHHLLFGLVLLILNTALITLTMMRNEDYRSAISIWEDAVQKRPNNAKAYQHLAQALEGEGQWKEAEAMHRLALRYQPNPWCFYSMGKIQFRRGNHDEAFHFLEEGVRFRYIRGEILIQRGLYRHLVGQSDRGEADVRQGLKIMRIKPQGYFYLAGILHDRIEMRQKENDQLRKILPRAEEVFSASLAAWPMNPFLWQGSSAWKQALADGIAANDRLIAEHQQEIPRRLAEGLVYDPNWAQLSRRAAIVGLRGDLDEIKDPQKIWIHREVLFQAKMAALTSDFKDPVILETLGWAYEANGQTDRAIQTYRQALEQTTPEQKELRRQIGQKLAKAVVSAGPGPG